MMKAKMRFLTGFGMAVIMTISMVVYAQAATPTAPAVAQTESNNDTVSQEPLGREGYASDIEYLLSDEYTEAVRQEFYRLINAYRRENGLRELEVNLELQDYADIRAAERGIVRGHIRLDGSAAGSGWHNSTNMINSRYAENAGGVTSFNICPKEHAATHFNRWKNSEAHNVHMLWDFDPHITMAFGISPHLINNGTWVGAAAIFATGY